MCLCTYSQILLYSTNKKYVQNTHTHKKRISESEKLSTKVTRDKDLLAAVMETFWSGERGWCSKLSQLFADTDH